MRGSPAHSPPSAPARAPHPPPRREPAASPPAVTARPRGPARLRRLAVAATSATFVLVGVGALVRATGSGLGCSGWPRCSPAHWLPPLQYHPIIEYTHRMVAFVDIVLVGLLALTALRRLPAFPRVVRPAVGAAALILVQAALGGIVVRGDLAPVLVTAHLAAAMLLVAALVMATVASFTTGIRPVGGPDGLTRLALMVAGATFILLVVGAYVRGAAAGLAFPDWPLMNGRAVPAISHLPQGLMFLHRVLALAVAVLSGLLVFRSRRERGRRRAVFLLSITAASLVGAQVLVGAANVWSRLAGPAVVAHVTLGALVWGALVAVAATAAATGAQGRAEGR